MKDPFDTGETARHLKTGVSGPSGSGKTCFGLDAKNHGMGPVAVLSLETGDVLLEKSPRWGGFKFLRTQSIEEMESAIGFLEENPGKYGLLLVDTITGIYEALVDAKAKEDGSVNKNAWGLIKRKWKSIMARLVNLPLHIVFVVHENDITEEDEKTGKMKVVGQKLDAEKSFIRNPDFLIRLTVSQDGKTRKGALLKVRGDTELHGFRIGQVLEEPNIGMFQKAIKAGTAEARVSPPEEVAKDNAAAMEGSKAAPSDAPPAEATDDEKKRVVELVVTCDKGFNAQQHKDNWLKKHRDEIAALKKKHPDLYQLIKDAYDKAHVGKEAA